MSETDSLLRNDDSDESIKSGELTNNNASNDQKQSLYDDENKNLPQPVVKTYWYRWYICMIFSILGLLQGAIWNTWSPIDESAEVAFGFTSSEIELLTNWGPISFIIFMPIYMWVLDNKGLRVSVVSTAFLATVGTALRCLPVRVTILKYLIHAGQFFNGIAGCVVMAAPPLLSNVWFPPNERITATGISTLFNYMGTGFGFIVGTAVDHPSNSTKNGSCLYVLEEMNNTCHEIHMIRREIMNVLYVECGITALVFLSMLVFFPSKPPLPPSVSASLSRISLKAGLLELRHHRQFWVVAFVMAIVIGNISGWIGVLPIILKPLNVGQSEAGMLGFVMSVVGCMVGMFVGWFTDRLKGRMRMMVTILFSVCLIVFIYFIIIANKWLNFVPFLPQSAEIWTACIIIGIATNAAVPLCMEMGADAGYPICEGTSTSIVVWLYNVASFLFLTGLSFAPNPIFANYIMIGCLAISIPMLIFFTNEQNRRLDLDKHLQVNGLCDDCPTESKYGSISVNTGTSGQNVSA